MKLCRTIALWTKPFASGRFADCPEVFSTCIKILYVFMVVVVKLVNQVIGIIPV